MTLCPYRATCLAVAMSSRVCVAAVILSAAATAAGQVAAPPATAEPTYGTPLSLSTDAYFQLADQPSVLLSDFALPGEQIVDLALRRLTLFAPNAVIVAGSERGDVPMPIPEVVAFGGQIVGRPGTSVFLALAPSSVNGYISRGKDRFIISSGPAGGSHAPLIYNPADLPAGMVGVGTFICRADELAGPIVEQIGRGSVALRGGPCRVAEIAIDTDWEFRQIFGNDADASAYAASLIAAVSEIYVNDLNIELQISYLRIWSTSADPWTGANTYAQLFEFRDYWVANMGSVARDLAHLLSARSLGGGLAWQGVVCDTTYGYAVSSGIDGWFPYPLQNNSLDNSDLIVVAHELGHNVGSPHTHNQVPKVDNCAGGDCSVTPNGTLMSYCHLCPGGLANILLQFHAQSVNSYILPYLDTTCDITTSAPSVVSDPADAGVCVGADAVFDVSASSAATLSYQWRKGGIDIGGATSASYTVHSVTPGDAGVYDCVVSNFCGATTSAAATLTVCTPGVNADLDDDCDVDLTDLGTLLLNFGMTGATRQDGDVNGDTVVDLTDLGDLLAAFDVASCQP